MSDSTQFISQALNDSKKTLEDFLNESSNLEQIAKAIGIFSNSLESEGKILSCGNGGSMCDAMHFAEELTGRYRKDRRALGALSLSDPSHMSCVSNDFGYQHIFSRMVTGLGRSGDAMLAISTSGNSQNVVNAVVEAKAKGIKTVGLLGKTGGKLKGMVDVPIIVDCLVTDRIQEVHIKLIHIFIEGIERKLFPEHYC